MLMFVCTVSRPFKFVAFTTVVVVVVVVVTLAVGAHSNKTLNNN